MAQDLLTAIALVLIIEGVLPVVAPRGWQSAIQQLSRQKPGVIRVGGLISMLAGALLLQFLH
jgi:hypothetical protein